VNHRSMRTRLMVSFAMIAAIGAAAFYIAARVLVPRLFEQRMGTGGPGSGAHGATNQHDAIVSSVNTAMVIALVTTLVGSTIVAIVMSRRTLHSVELLRLGAGRLAAGHYETRVPHLGEAELVDLADDINHLAATLADIEQRRAALIGDVAHEMRTPLTTLNGTLEGFDDGLFTADELRTTVRTEVTRLEHLAGDLAAVSRAEEGRLDLDRQRCDLRELIQTVVDSLRPRFDSARVGLNLESPRHVPAVVDHERMVQVISNLLGNALAYTPAGGRVDIAVSALSSGLRVSVTDTGRGLQPDDVERIFERFYRTNPNDHTGGTGIGLTISRAIARAHGGDLTATSPGPGLGATFELVLPAG
jgi:signal transduction histidine kinase